MPESWAAFLAACREEDRLLSVLLELTYACPFRCVFCYNDRRGAGRPLETERWEAALEEMAGMGVLFLTFSGGEPTVHPAFFRLGRKARELGFVLRIKTAGSHLGDTAIRRIREELDPFVVELSLHGATPATHERQTRVPGSFGGLLRAVEAFRRAGQRIELRTVLTRYNEHEIEELFALADRLGAPLLVDPVVTPRADGDPSPLALAASTAGVRRLGELLARRAAAVPESADDGCPSPRGRRHCGAGTSTLAVDPSGDVLPCVEWRLPLGNLRRSTLREIWESSPVLWAVRRRNERARETVAGQRPEEAAAFCPALAGVLEEPAAGNPGERRALLFTVVSAAERGGTDPAGLRLEATR